jgi:hypothetical protein
MEAIKVLMIIFIFLPKTGAAPIPLEKEIVDWQACAVIQEMAKQDNTEEEQIIVQCHVIGKVDNV